MSEKEGWTPPEDRKSEHALLTISDLEYLDRLVEKGEGLIHNELHFAQAEALLRTNHAEVKEFIGPCRLIVATELGLTLARIREEEKLKRIALPTLKDKV